MFPNNTMASGGETEIGKQAVRTCNSYWNPQDPVAEYDIDDFILGMSSQVTEREDTIITPDLRGMLRILYNIYYIYYDIYIIYL